MRWAGGLGIALSLAACPLVAACYQPTVPAGAPCDPALDNCPAGQRCETTANGSYCGAVPQGADAKMMNQGDARIDSAPGCFGTGLVTNVCLMPPPTGAVDVTADRTINTAMIGNNNCDSILPQPNHPSLCLVAGTSITIAAGVKLIGIGPNPLLLVATDTFTVTGTIDVSSHTAAMTSGAGAQTTCGSGGNGAAGGGTDGAGGGGAGGSFGTIGGAGGSGRNGGGGGNALAATTINDVRGGCPGFVGGAGSGGGFGGPGAGGAGGGAVYLIAGNALTIGGVINASGAGGGAGLDSKNAGAGGGGGGAGGMVGLDAPSITLTGSIYANGAGGGGGNGAQPANNGAPGLEPASATTQANGGTGGAGGGGAGGKGYARDMPATTGANGTSQYCAGGGGGGGAGAVRVFGVAPSSLGGAISPPPT